MKLAFLASLCASHPATLFTCICRGVKMVVSTTNKSLLLFSLVITAATTSSSSSSYSSFAAHHRRLLHQPFFPLSTAAPPTYSSSLPPQPETQPKYQFSTTPGTQQKPFFPSFPSLPPSSPPPPSVSSVTTFPANISSLLFPQPPPASISRHHHLITTISISLSILFATILVALSGIFLYSRRRRQHRHIATISEKTSSRSDSLRLFPPNAIQPNGSPKPPKLPHHPGVSNTSSEFLYLGTLANSRNGLEDHQKATNLSNAGIAIGVSSQAYQKLGSPEIRPLPPLPRQNYTPSYKSGEALLGPSKEEGEAGTETYDDDDDEGEQFFSPRGSSGRKECRQESQLPIGSSSRRELQGLQGENFGSTSFNSRTASYPYSNSASPANSVSTSPSAVSSSSLISSKSKSHNSIQFNVGILRQNEQSPTRLERVVGVTNPFGQMGLCPPPPPPPPPPRFWDISSGVARDLSWMSSGPPTLVMPSKPFLVQNGESSLTFDQLQPNSSVERTEETPKPKLKPLYWDKVRVSSNRGMVWDSFKSSSFQ